MGTQFAWFYDVALIAILLTGLFSGGRRGFTRSVILLVGFAAAGFISFSVSKSASSAIYDAVIAPPITRKLEACMENIDITSDIKEYADKLETGTGVTKEQIKAAIDTSDKDIVAGLSDVTGISYDNVEKKLNEMMANYIGVEIDEKMPPYVTDAISEFSKNSREDFTSLAKAITSTSEEAAKYISDTVAKPVIVPIIRLVVFMIVFSVLSAVVSAIARTAKFVKRIPLAGTVDTILGSALGIVEGIVVAIIVAMGIKVIILLTSDDVIAINTDTIEQTRIFKEFYYLTIFDKFK